MKKTKSGKRRSMAKPKLSASPKSIDAYLAAVPEPARGTLQKVRAAIRSAVPPGATETISYNIPAFKHGEVIIWFAAFASHCSIFPTGRIIEQFKDDLKAFTISKGTVQFPSDKPFPASLLKKMVKARLAQIAAKKRR
jgi:uncharacterized protein YdhG (YjbR/CyaY superfamily)